MELTAWPVVPRRALQLVLGQCGLLILGFGALPFVLHLLYGRWPLPYAHRTLAAACPTGVTLMLLAIRPTVGDAKSVLLASALTVLFFLLAGDFLINYRIRVGRAMVT